MDPTRCSRQVKDKVSGVFRQCKNKICKSHKSLCKTHIKMEGVKKGVNIPDEQSPCESEDDMQTDKVQDYHEDLRALEDRIEEKLAICDERSIAAITLAKTKDQDIRTAMADTVGRNMTKLATSVSIAVSDVYANFAFDLAHPEMYRQASLQEVYGGSARQMLRRMMSSDS